MLKDLKIENIYIQFVFQYNNFEPRLLPRLIFVIEGLGWLAVTIILTILL